VKTRKLLVVQLTRSKGMFLNMKIEKIGETVLR